MNNSTSLRIIKKVLDYEIEAISDLKKKVTIGSVFQAIKMIRACKKNKGKVITMGLGTSSIQARKIAHNFSCIEIPALFLSTEVAVHGGSGVLQEQDLVIAFSRGGETREILDIIPVIKQKKIKMISVTESEDSELAKAGDLILQIKVVREADPFNMLATSSTICVLAIFDAITVLMMQQGKYKKDQFAIIHPGGSVGERLKKHVQKIKHKDSKIKHEEYNVQL